MKDLSTPSIMWFRQDLRLRDNDALIAAAKHQSMIAVYIWAPEEEEPWSPGGASKWWLHHSLARLGESLEQQGSCLHILRGQSLENLRELTKSTGASAIYWNRRYEPQIVARDKIIKKELVDSGLVVESFNGSLLNEPWDVLKKDGTPYRVYTPYWRQARTRLREVTAKRRPKIPPLPPEFKAQHELSDLELLPLIPWDQGIKEIWQTGEEAAKRLLSKFAQSKIANYETKRDIPGVDGTSLLSPYLHFGCISPRQAWAAASQCPPTNPNAMRYKMELVWRDFAANLLYHFPHTTKEPMQDKFKKFPWKKSKKNLAAWQRGVTGYPIVDAGMRQLWHTGWMHNRVRMIVASFLVKDYQISWRAGASWFWDTLVDADLASNTMGWQWSAGCGADAAPYFRVFNPVLQGKRFDSEGEYVRQWVPELAPLPDKWIHNPWEAPSEVLEQAGVRLGDTYPHPTVDHGEAKLEALLAYDKIK